MSNVFLIQCKQLLLLDAGIFVASQEIHQLDSDQMFPKPFPLGFFLCGAFFTFAKGHELLHFFNDII